MTNENFELWDDILSHLVYTTKGLKTVLLECVELYPNDDVLALYEDNEFKEYLNSTIFRCAGCDLWKDQSELSDNEECYDCE